eukprot:1242937-Pleurochrysis_carterae.AAC.1
MVRLHDKAVLTLGRHDAGVRAPALVRAVAACSSGCARPGQCARAAWRRRSTSVGRALAPRAR